MNDRHDLDAARLSRIGGRLDRLEERLLALVHLLRDCTDSDPAPPATRSRHLGLARPGVGN